MPATTDRARQYADLGFLSGIDIFSPDEIGGFRHHFDRFDHEMGTGRPQADNRQRHLDQPFVWRMASDPRIVSLMQELMGPDILLLGSDFFCKYPEPQATAFIAWHQDVTYWGLEPPVAHTVWIAVDDCDLANGCMRVIPGSHRNGMLTHGKSQRTGNMLSVNQAVPDDLVRSADAVDLVLKAGQVSVHEGHLLHASLPNRSQQRRCGLAVRCVPTHVRQAKSNSLGINWPTMLLAGQDRFGHFVLQPPPAGQN